MGSWDGRDERRLSSEETELHARFHVDVQCSAFVLARIRLMNTASEDGTTDNPSCLASERGPKGVTSRAHDINDV